MSAISHLPSVITDSSVHRAHAPASSGPFVAHDFPDLLTYYARSFKTTDTVGSVEPTALFQQQPFPEKSMRPLVRNESLSDWILPVLLICFSLLAWVIVSYRKRFSQLIQAAYSRQQMSFLLREGGGSYDLINLSLGFIFICALALLIYQTGESFNGTPMISGYRFSSFLGVAGGIVGWLIVRLVLIKLLSWTFKNFEITSYYLINSMSFHFITGILLLPFLIINAYTHTPFFLFLSLGLAGILFILRLFRGLIIGLSDTKFSIFYLFFYLCTVEILPILVIVKFAKDNL